MKKYIYQGFLANCDINKVDLLELYTKDVDNVQIISVTYLDEKIDTEEDLNAYLNQYDLTCTLVLDDDRPIFTNTIIKEYADKIFKSYLFWFSKKGFKCYWTQSH